MSLVKVYVFGAKLVNLYKTLFSLNVKKFLLLEVVKKIMILNILKHQSVQQIQIKILSIFNVRSPIAASRERFLFDMENFRLNVSSRNVNECLEARH